MCVFYKGRYGLWVPAVFSYVEEALVLWFEDHEEKRKGRHGSCRSHRSPSQLFLPSSPVDVTLL